jgi:cytidylate kinase
VIHAFCYAPRPALITRAARRLGISEKEAAHVVDERNRQREQYVRKYWKRSWSAVENYHLCLNTEWLGVDGAAEVVVRLARERFL